MYTEMEETSKFEKIMNILKSNGLGYGSVRDYHFFDKLTDADFDDPTKVQFAVEQIKKYNEYESNNSNKYPEYIMRAVRQNLGLNEFDFSKDSEINKMDKDEILHRVCVWNNLIGYEKTIKNWIKDIYGVAL